MIITSDKNEQVTKLKDEIKEKVTKKEKSEKEVNLTLVGDFLFESPFYKSVDNGYDMYNYFSLVKEKFLNDDITIGNMEVVIGNDELQVSGDEYNFCAPRYIGDLVSSLDFQVLGTANNHTFDRGEAGIKSTLEYFNNTNILTVGTYLDDTDRANPRILEKNGIKFGFLAYTYGTNSHVPDNLKNMIGLYKNDDEHKEAIKKDVDLLKENVDVIIVMMHWGTEFTFTPNNEQKEMANFLNSIGVDIVYGSHSHSIQPIEMIGDEHKTLVYYSLGNFVSNDDDIARTPKGQETFDNAYQIGLLSTLKVKATNDERIELTDIKTEAIVNYFDINMNNWLLIPFDDYIQKYERNHFRYNLGLNKDFIKYTYEDVIAEEYR
ncbi:MAG: CapA family protein [Erysipelotrichales bacterium]|nr:CapA family protein [Erysipelotrichales bacterium]